MSDVSKIKIGDEYYDIKDATARAGGDAPIEHIAVNGTEQEITDKTVNISVPTKVSQLTNDVPYGTEEDVENAMNAAVTAGNEAIAAKETADSALTKATEAKDSIPTKVSQLENDAGYVDSSALSEYAKESEVEAVKESAITAITVNGEDVPVESNTAAIEFDDVSNGSDGIKALTVDGDLFEYVNEICDTIGVYFMRATSDTPNIPETAAFFIMLLRNSNTQATMIAFRAGSNTNTYMCKEQSSTWGEWTQIIPSGGGSEPTYDADSETLVF